MSMQNNWLSNNRRRLGLAHRWGNGPASLWIAEDFGCCASGRWWNEVRVCGLKFGGAWIPGLLRTHCYGERIGAPTPIAHSTTLPYRRNTSPKARRFKFKWFLYQLHSPTKRGTGYWSVGSLRGRRDANACPSTRNHHSAQAKMRLSDSSDSRIHRPRESRFYEGGY
jgi:hypothetical protein